MIPAARLAELTEMRVHDPAAISRAWASRRRRRGPGPDGRLFIIAADHPARGANAVGDDPWALADRADLLDRLAVALADPRLDGVLASPDVLDDLAWLGLLEGKIAVGSMNRGGLTGSAFEIDDRFTGHTVPGMVRDGIDMAKTLLRICLDDPATAAALERNAHAVTACAEAGLPIMLEPFLTEWVDGRARNVLTPEAVIRTIGISQALGTSSAHTWLKLPVVEDMERVMAATTLPTLLLGGERADDQDGAFASWEAALALPGVRGLVVGRSLLHPVDGDLAGAVDRAATMVHGPLTAPSPTPGKDVLR